MLDTKRRGFTLIELLVVISVIGLMASVVLVSVNSARVKARDAKRKMDLKQISTALEMYYQDHYNQYPTVSVAVTAGAPSCLSSTIAFSGVSYWNSCWLGILSNTYVGKMPLDPSNNDNGNACAAADGSHVYGYYSDGKRYVLFTNMENPPATNDSNYYIGNSISNTCSGFANWAIRQGY